MTRQDYNGWTNYETWLVKLWIDNEESSHLLWVGEARRILSECDNDKPKATLALAKLLQEVHEDESPCGTSGVYTDLMTSALGEVDWQSIAESFIDQDGTEKVTPQEMVKRFPQLAFDPQEYADTLLEDQLCPNCGDRDGIYVLGVTTGGHILADGIDQKGDMEYDGDSACRCDHCHNTGTLDEFTCEGLDAFLKELKT